METKIKKIPIYGEKLPVIGFKEASVYVAVDGREFDTEKDCTDYEAGRKKQEMWEAIKKIVIPDHLQLEGYPSTYYYAGTMEERSLILQQTDVLNKQRSYRSTVTVNGKDSRQMNSGEIGTALPRGAWIGWWTVDGGDYPDNYDVYTLQYVKDILSRHITQLDAIEKGEAKC